MTNGSSQATVFVVDDDPSFRTAVSRLLRGAGHQVKVQLRGMSGVELQRQLAASGSSTPVIYKGDRQPALQVFTGLMVRWAKRPKG
jgi:FixJ family two-component response regulator